MSRSADARATGRPRSRGLFERFPHGLLLIDEGRRVVSLNEKGCELLALDDRLSEPIASTCCDLVCQTADRQLDMGTPCITERVLKTGEPFPDVQIELGQMRLSVGAARVDAEDVRVLFQLRRETTEVGDGPAIGRSGVGRYPRLRVETLGGTRVELGNDPLTGDWIEQRPGLLLKYMVCHRDGVAPSERIAEALWPDASPQEALVTLRHYVHVLRSKLEPGRAKRTPSSFIITNRGGYSLNAQQVQVDAEEFENHAREGLRRFGSGQLEPAVTVLEQAVRLYRGEFLADEPDAEWALEERERLHHLVTRVFAALVEVRLATGELEAAAGYSRRLADLEPLDTDVQRQFIEICLRQGRRSDAVRRYGVLRKRTLQEFGAEPDFTLSDLHG
jgi:DNA-binding SARP family transcriptional activator